MSTPADILARWLAAQPGVGTLGGTTGWAISIAAAPETPDDMITLYDTGGAAPDNDLQDIFYPTVQVRTRSATYVDGYDKQEQIRGLLINRGDVGGINAVWMDSQPQAIGLDDNDRWLLTANYRTFIV